MLSPSCSDGLTWALASVPTHSLLCSTSVPLSDVAVSVLSPSCSNGLTCVFASAPTPLPICRPYALIRCRGFGAIAVLFGRFDLCIRFRPAAIADLFCLTPLSDVAALVLSPSCSDGLTCVFASATPPLPICSGLYALIRRRGFGAIAVLFGRFDLCIRFRPAAIADLFLPLRPYPMSRLRCYRRLVRTV